MTWVDKAAAEQENSMVWWTRARIQAAKGEYDAAVESARKAKELGAANPEDMFFKNNQQMIDQRIEEWEGM